MAVRITKQILEQIISYLGLSGKMGLPEVSLLSKEEYLEARSNWISAGIAELDFDGKVYFNQPYVRMLYNIVNARAVLVFKCNHSNIWCVRGPVDLLWIETVDGDEVCNLHRSSNSTFGDSLLDEWRKCENGKLHVYREADGKVKDIEMNSKDLDSDDNKLTIQQFFFVEAG